MYTKLLQLPYVAKFIMSKNLGKYMKIVVHKNFGISDISSYWCKWTYTVVTWSGEVLYILDSPNVYAGVVWPAVLTPQCNTEQTSLAEAILCCWEWTTGSTPWYGSLKSHTMGLQQSADLDCPVVGFLKGFMCSDFTTSQVATRPLAPM